MVPVTGVPLAPADAAPVLRPAVAFYLAHGFTIVAAGDGSGNEEHAPDYLLRWTP
jgi:hypothetical protein